MTVVSAVLDPINASVHFTSAELSLLGTLAPFSFALCGAIVPRIAERIGLERITAVSAILMTAALIARVFVTDATGFLVTTTLSLLGMGVGNITLPPLVKRYYPMQMALMTSIYSAALAMSATLPPLLAVPVTASWSWRVALGVWAGVALIAVVPWILLLVRTRRSAVASIRETTGKCPSEQRLSGQRPVGQRVPLIRSRVAWAITIGLTISTITAYFMFAWLPNIGEDLGNLSIVAAGLTLSGFAMLGLPINFLGPIFAARFGLPSLFVVSGVCLGVGYAGLLLAPSPLFLLWIFFVGLGPLLYPACLAGINLRTESIVTAAQLSGFAQAVSYGTAGVLIFVFRWMRGTGLGWTPTFVLLALSGVVAIVVAIPLRRPLTIEEELAAR